MNARGPCNGYALVLVLWLVTLLAVITGAYHAVARAETQLVARAIYGAQAEAAAEAGLWIAVRGAALRDPRPRVPVRQRLSFNGAQIEVSTTAVSGRINLNRAGSELLAHLLSATGSSADERARLVDAILDWRDADHDALPHGAEDADYAAAGADHGARDGMFATVDELRHVAGMTEDIYRRISRLLTVHGSHRRVDPYAAGSSILAVVTDADATTIAQLLTRRDEAEPDQELSLAALDRRFLRSTADGVYVVASSASAGDIEARLEAVVQVPRRGSRQVLTLSWNSAPEWDGQR